MRKLYLLGKKKSNIRIDIRSKTNKRLYFFYGKRFFDILLTALALIALFPVMALTGTLVWLNLCNPVIYQHVRPGQHGKPFILYKFRTMTNYCDSQGKLLPDFKRLTKLGKFLRRLSLDELPALFNVLKGEMSLVGPRPLLMEYMDKYTIEQTRRHEVKPGLTGWAQVNGRNAITWEEKFKFDVWYVDNWSLLLDIKILWMTLVKVTKMEGINQPGYATMEVFRGTQGLSQDKV